MDGEGERKVIPVTRMDCPTCVRTIEKELMKLKGVKNARVNFLMKKIIVDYGPKEVDLSAIEETIEDLGYRISYKKYDSLFEKISKIFRREERFQEDFKRLNDHNFEELVINSNKPVIVLYTSPLCPTCKVLKSKLSEIGKKFKNRIYIYELDIMTTKKWEDHNVMSVPTLLYFDTGKAIARMTGLVETNEIEITILNLID